MYFEKPGVVGDATVLEQSALLRNVESNEWLGTAIPSLHMGNVRLRPYLLGDCVFELTTYMMRSLTKPEKVAQRELEAFDAVATSTKKPIDCLFGMITSASLYCVRGFTYCAKMTARFLQVRV